MKTLFFALGLSAASIFSHMSAGAVEPINAVMHEREFTLSNYYVVESDVGPLGNVVKHSIRLRTSYEYYDDEGANLANGYLRVMSLGSLFTWAGTMDVYDGNGERIGLIEGAVLTLLPSKFNIYDGNDELVAVAYMDSNCMGFTITDAVNETKTLASLSRVFVPDVTDHWTIQVRDANAFDSRLLYVFGAFVMDNQGDFREDD